MKKGLYRKIINDKLEQDKNNLLYIKCKLLERKEGIFSSFINDLIAFINDHYLKSELSYSKHICINKINDLIITFEMFSIHYQSVETYIKILAESEGLTKYGSIRTLFNEVLVDLFLNNNNKMEAFLM